MPHWSELQAFTAMTNPRIQSLERFSSLSFNSLSSTMKEGLGYVSNGSKPPRQEAYGSRKPARHASETFFCFNRDNRCKKLFSFGVSERTVPGPADLGTRIRLLSSFPRSPMVANFRRHVQSFADCRVP
jgi:hypothetical protein